jgi:large subunit ribosomal protein L4
MKLAEPKTRLMAVALNNLVGQSSALVLISEKNETSDWVVRSTNNLPDTKVLMAGYLNIRDLMVFDKLVLPVAVLDVIATNLG